jgi:general secretion pathway protein A
MYAEHFRLRKEPFSIAPDPRFLFMSAQHREALAHLLYGVGGGGGFVLLTGEIGAGKTTVCRCFLEQIPTHCRVAYIFNPKLTVPELLQTICQEFHIALPEGTSSVKQHVDALNAFLLHAHARGQSAVLIIDEAQSLAPDVLEQLRLLTNLETHERKLLQIILIGQPELRTMLAQPGLEQLAQRVIARYHLGALTEAETRSYVKHRLAVAGGSKLPFDREAMARLYALSGGVPRRINLLADRALLGAYSQGMRKVDRATLEKAAREVFGPATLDRRPWLWGVGVTALALAAGFALWSLRGGTGSPGTPAVATAASGARAGAAAAAASAASSAGLATPALADIGEVLAAAPASEDAGLRELARDWQVPLGSGDACSAATEAGLSCHRSRAGLAGLRQLGRPAVLTLQGPQGSAVHALLVGLDEVTALMQVGERRWRVALPVLAEVWRGEFTTLWRPPPGWRAGAEVTPPAVRDWVRQQLAAAGQGDDTRPLRERVWSFQVASGLAPDGLAGPLTLMQLARAGTSDEPRLKVPSKLPP